MKHEWILSFLFCISPVQFVSVPGWGHAGDGVLEPWDGEVFLHLVVFGEAGDD